MFDIFAAIFDRTLLVIRFNPESDHSLVVLFNATIHTALRGAIIYLAIRVVITAVSHGSF